eukprot:GHVL01018184.1.p1 GENE.GHVL01018184.1~~GHVL01018184.1.p1  ORF type:complete len:209 (+),score=27.77 GHVL01018184.1:1207-1833(+)
MTDNTRKILRWQQKLDLSPLAWFDEHKLLLHVGWAAPNLKMEYERQEAALDSFSGRKRPREEEAYTTAEKDLLARSNQIEEMVNSNQHESALESSSRIIKEYDSLKILQGGGVHGDLETAIWTMRYNVAIANHMSRKWSDSINDLRVLLETVSSEQDRMDTLLQLADSLQASGQYDSAMNTIFEIEDSKTKRFKHLDSGYQYFLILNT